MNGEKGAYEPRTNCASRLHDHPLPRVYTDADNVAEQRRAAGWLNPRCPRCQAYGWKAPTLGMGGAGTPSQERTGADSHGNGALFCECAPTPEKGHICVCGPEWTT